MLVFFEEQPLYDANVWCGRTYVSSTTQLFKKAVHCIHTYKQTNNNDLLEKDGGTKNCIYKD